MLYAIWLESQLDWNIPLLIDLTCIGVVYAFLVNRFTNIRIYEKQFLLFFFGLGLSYLMVGSPLSTISQLSFSLHMVQMSILYFIVPPILILGIPDALFQRMWKVSVMRAISKLFLPPRAALIAFAGLFLIYHIPAVLTVLSQSSFVHDGYIVLLFVLTFSMWWPITGPYSSQRFSEGQKKRFVLVSGLVLMPACVLFIFSALLGGMNNPFLSHISLGLCLPQTSHFDILPPPFNTKLDQFISGILMLGIHKFGLMMTFHLGEKEHDQEWEMDNVQLFIEETSNE